MRHPRSILVSLAFASFMISSNGFVLHGQERVDAEMIARIKMEAFQRSKILDTFGYLTDVHAIRLANSAQYRAAAEWCRKTLAEWGLEARLEPYGNMIRGWNLERFSLEMTEPYYMNIIAYPKGFTRGTNGLVRGKPVCVEIGSSSDFPKYKGTLKGAIVMNRKATPAGLRINPVWKRLTDEDLRASTQVMSPGSPRDLHQEEEGWIKSLKTEKEIRAFFQAEGIEALLEPSRVDGLVISVPSFGEWTPNEPQTYPSFIVAREQYGRIWRLFDRNIPVSLELSLKARFDDSGVPGVNVIAEIAGTDPRIKDEIVLFGGHLDAIPPSAGAMDDGGACAIMMEALRILKAVGVKPRRTIRLGLWDGEEIGYYGSMAYTKQHFGDPETMALKPDHAKISAYFGLDAGAGRIRGIGLQGNEAARPFFESVLAPFAYLGVTAISAQNRGGMDHLPFDSVGLPAFPFIQDPLDYMRRVHTNLDVFEGVIEEDMQQAAAVIAGVLYHAAMRDEKLPRKPRPEAKKLPK